MLKKRWNPKPQKALAFPNAHGLTVRYAVKACPAAGVIRILNRAGLHIDASSGYEALRAMRAGVPAAQIQLTTQQLPDNLADLVRQGVLFNACSLHQLAAYGQLLSGPRSLRAHQPRPRLRTQQPHQYRWPFVELRHLARASRPSARNGRSNTTCNSPACTAISARAATQPSGSTAPA